jgi:hypothetical protein
MSVQARGAGSPAIEVFVMQMWRRPRQSAALPSLPWFGKASGSLPGAKFSPLSVESGSQVARSSIVTIA